MSYACASTSAAPSPTAWCADEKGELHIFKSPSTPGAFQEGFINVLRVAAEHYGLDARRFPRP